jgi:hypothetical protein
MTDLLMTPRCLLLATGRALVVCRCPLLRTLTGPASCTQHKLLMTSQTDGLVTATVGSGDLGTKEPRQTCNTGSRLAHLV